MGNRGAQEVSGLQSTQRFADYMISASFSCWTICLNRLKLILLELRKGEVFIICVGLQVFPNVCLCILHFATSWNWGKELRIDDLSGRTTADFRIPLMRVVTSEVVPSNFKLSPFVINIKRLGHVLVTKFSFVLHFVQKRGINRIYHSDKMTVFHRSESLRIPFEVFFFILVTLVTVVGISWSLATLNVTSILTSTLLCNFASSTVTISSPSSSDLYLCFDFSLSFSRSPGQDVSNGLELIDIGSNLSFNPVYFAISPRWAQRLSCFLIIWLEACQNFLVIFVSKLRRLGIFLNIFNIQIFARSVLNKTI